ncbi:MAG TPA: cytochrome ubiquinol oxidase subunit I [Candidatus Binatus sp.]|nr:cytochrome ubiquinol oxidase subunit I [Candidatus Binatus sp.]
MPDLLAARFQMAISLGFHIVFAVVGMAMPLCMVIAEACWLRTGDAGWRVLAERWAKGTAVLFAVGAVSGTVLSFELGLLWPRFMAFAGPIIGLPFALEGFAFFTEAVFLGVYLYGWERVGRTAHLAAGAIVAVSGALSGFLVVCANGWMNTPTGFTLIDGRATDVRPLAAMWNPMAVPEAVHMVLAAYAATGFAVAGIHASRLRHERSNVFHRRALAVALAVGGVAAVLQPLAGDVLARAVARRQPAKLAALEGLFVTQRGAPLRIGGLPDPSARVTRYALEIPRGLSLLAYHDPDAVVRGLDAVPPDQWPPVVPVHVAFQVMVGLGLAMAAAAVWGAGLAWRRGRLPDTPGYLIALAALTPAGLVAVEAGWVVTEVGRQPWIIQGVMRTADAVTPMPGLVVPLTVFTAVYVLLALTVIVLLRRLVATSPFVGGRGA